MGFIQLASGRIVNVDYIADFSPKPGGAFHVRWRDGRVEIFNASDGLVLRQEVLSRAEEGKPQTTNEEKPKPTSSTRKRKATAKAS